MTRDESKVQEAERVVLFWAVEWVAACADYQYTITKYGEGEAELHYPRVEEAEEALRTAVADLLAAEAAA